MTHPAVADGAVHVYHQYTIRVAEDRDGLAAALRDEHGVGSGMFYPIPNHRLPPFRAERRPARDRARRARVPVAAGPPVAVSDDDLERIVDRRQHAAKAGG